MHTCPKTVLFFLLFFLRLLRLSLLQQLLRQPLRFWVLTMLFYLLPGLRLLLRCGTCSTTIEYGCISCDSGC